MSVSACTDCGRALAVNPRRKGTRCQPCAMRAVAMSPEKRRKCSEAMKRHFADDAVRAAHAKAARDGLRRAIAERPELRARLRETGKRLGALGKGNILTPAGSPQRRRAARAQSEFYMKWCPPEYRSGYHDLVRKKGVKAADARRMTEDLIEADKARYLATGVLPQAARVDAERRG